MQSTIHSPANSKKILLYVDKRSADFQRAFIAGLCPLLDELYESFRQLDLSCQFEASDIVAIPTTTAEKFIRLKVLPTIKNPTIGGQKTTPERVYELMDLDLRDFTQAFEAVKTYVRAKQVHAAGYSLKFSYNASLLDLEEGNFTMNLAAFDLWLDNNCKVFVESEQQEQVYLEMKRIVDSLNNLKKIGKPQLSPVDCLVNHPQIFLSEKMRRMVVHDSDSGEYLVNHEFIASH